MTDKILEYVEPLFRFCVKRLCDRQEAEDLTQEILLHIIEGMGKYEVSNLNAFVWKVAHNRFNRRLRQRYKEIEVYSGDCAADVASDGEIDDDILRRGEHDTVFKSLHSLSALYRDIMVDFYIHELDIYQIAAKRNITVQAVKWRLHTGRQKIKERVENMSKTYEKLNWTVGCNGHNLSPDKYLGSQMQRAIPNACYNSPKTIEEISLATGIPTLYIDEIIDNMLYGEVLEQVGSKYQANFILLRQDDDKRMRDNLSAHMEKVAQAAWAAARRTLDEIGAIGFYGSGFPLERLGHILVPELVRYADKQLRADDTSLQPGQRPIRKDGGSGWYIAREGTSWENMSGCNCIHYGAQREIVHYWHGNFDFMELAQFYNNNSSYINNINPLTGEYSPSCEEETSKLLSLNLIEKQDGSYRCTFPILTKAQYAKMQAILREQNSAITEAMQAWTRSLVKEFNSFTPKHLKSQILGNIDSYTYTAVNAAVKLLQQQGNLPIPNEGETFTANVFLICN